MMLSWEFGTESSSPVRASPPTRARREGAGPGARNSISRPLHRARGLRGIVSDFLKHGGTFLGKGNAPLLSEGVDYALGDLPYISESTIRVLHHSMMEERDAKIFTAEPKGCRLFLGKTGNVPKDIWFGA